jgi:hypothetical protein
LADGAEGRGGLRVGLVFNVSDFAAEFAVGQPLQPGGAGVVTAGLVDAREGVFGDSEL